MKGCVPTGGVLCASLELLPSALEWIMEEDKCCFPVARNALGDVLHVWGFGHRVPAAFVLEHDLGAVCDVEARFPAVFVWSCVY